jgi:hypothetical protein
MASRPRKTHGEYVGGKESAEHYVWRTMLRRHHGRGAQYYTEVTVCERWHVFENFLVDMGRRPSDDHSIDRIDVKGDYEPGNCRWATRSEQQKNKRTTRKWEQDGKIGTLYEWAEWLGVSPQLALYRINQWGTFEKGKEWRLLQRPE